MKHRLLLTLWLLGAALAGYAQPTASNAQLMKLVSPPGTLLVQDSLWMDETEVANIYWLEYLHLLRQDSTEAQYQSARPDTAVWGRALSANDPYITYYLRYPGFRYYPVVGISWAQAVRYCRWRSAMVNKRLHSTEYLKKHPKLRNYKFRVEYRLPTVREWELAAAGKLDPAQYPYGGVFPPAPGSKRYKISRLPTLDNAARCLHDSTNCPPETPIFQTEFVTREHYYGGDLTHAFCCQALDEHHPLGSFNDGAVIMGYVYGYPPNAYGLYSMIGNAAELTATPGVAKGGSWRHSVKQSALQTNLPYQQPQAWLGFRCACTVYIEPKK